MRSRGCGRKWVLRPKLHPPISGWTPADSYSVPLCWLQAYIYLNEGERLLKMLKDDKSWSHTFESATFYSLKGQVRNRGKQKHVLLATGAFYRRSSSRPCTSCTLLPPSATNPCHARRTSRPTTPTSLPSLASSELFLVLVGDDVIMKGFF